LPYERTAHLTIDLVTSVDGDLGLVRNMRHALLASAWKFTRGRDAVFFFTLSPGDG